MVTDSCISIDCGSTASNQRELEVIEKATIYLMTMVNTRANSRDYMAHNPEYIKSNKWSDIEFKIYI